MRKFLASAAIVGLIAFIPPALAQDQEHHDQPSPPHGEQHGGPRGAPHGEAQPHGPAPRAATPGNPGPRSGEHAFGMQNGGARRGPPANQRSNAQEPSRPAPRPAPSMAMRPNQPPENAPGSAMRGPEHRPAPNTAMRGPAHDFRGVRNYHRNFDAQRHFHAAPYVRPRGFYVHHWTWGQTLPPLFWARRYWLADFAAYDLPPPPPGAVWVRVDDDALLIDQYNGMIIEVDYGVFY